MSNFNKCIFCLIESNYFNTIEHIVPESLGNTDDFLENAVCDKCQNYLGKEVESFILAKTNFAFWKTISGTRSKKGKSPFFNPSQHENERGAICNYHSYTDNDYIIHPIDNESIIAVDIQNKDMLKKIINGEKTKFYLTLTPKMLIYIGRFLGKIALEYWCKEFKDDVYNNQFNELRNYVRYGTTNSIWPITLSHLIENNLVYRAVHDSIESRTLYAYSFHEDIKSKLILFCFEIGSERYSIILNCKFPEGEIVSHFLPIMCEGAIGLPSILFYDLQSKE